MNYMTKKLLVPNSEAQCSNFEIKQPCLLGDQVSYDVSSLQMSYADWFTSPSVGILNLSSSTFMKSKIDDRLCFKSPYSNSNSCPNKIQFDINVGVPKTVNHVPLNNSIQSQASPYIR